MNTQAQQRPSSRSFAAVTGASSGIGYELARQFAANNYDLIIAAQDDGIVRAAAELEGLGAAVHAVSVDLAAPGAVDQLFAEIVAVGRPLDAIAINAGVGVAGDFRETGLAAELRLIELNCAVNRSAGLFTARTPNECSLVFSS